LAKPDIVVHCGKGMRIVGCGICGMSVKYVQTVSDLTTRCHVKDLDRLLHIVRTRLPALTYLSLLGNEACPDQLSSHDKDEDDYRRYR